MLNRKEWNYAAYYRWCMARHLRAEYVEATLECTEMSNDEVSVHKDLRTSQIQSNDQDVKRMMALISSFTNPSALMSTPMNYTVYHLLKAQEIGENAIKHFIKARLVDKSMGFHEPIKRN